jgi:hypothetical protein
MPGSRRDRPPLLGAIGSSIARTSPTAHGGTVREDYRADGDAWRYFPFDDASSHAYRRSEDGLAGLCDREQRLCFALSFWNGRDPMLKERIFGLSGLEGNHGEDAKEYWWSLDATPTYSWLCWLYHYPQAEFPYAGLRQENANRTRTSRNLGFSTQAIDIGKSLRTTPRPRRTMS